MNAFLEYAGLAPKLAVDGVDMFGIFLDYYKASHNSLGHPLDYFFGEPGIVLSAVALG